VKHLNITLSDDEYDELSGYKDEHELTWKELLKERDDN